MTGRHKKEREIEGEGGERGRERPRNKLKGRERERERPRNKLKDKERDNQ